MPHHFKPKHPAVEVGKAIWIVVADAGHARILSPAPDDKGPLEERGHLENDAARVEDHDALSDRAGHVTQGPGGIGHAFEPRVSHGEHVAETFAKIVCARLDKARIAGEVSKIYLLAAPQFLGLMRKNLDKDTHRLVAEEFATDLVQHSAVDIRKALPALL